MKKFSKACFILLLPILFACGSEDEKGFKFEVKLSDNMAPVIGEGRLFIILNEDTTINPIQGRGWFNPPPTFVIDIKDWASGDLKIINRGAPHYPIALDSLPAGKYAIQAVLDINKTERDFANGSGNYYSTTVVSMIDPSEGLVSIELSEIMEEREFEETEFLKEVRVESKLLSDFYGFPITIKAGIALPGSYFEYPERKYPVLYIIPGFGGRHYNISRYKKRMDMEGATEKIFVVLDPDSHLGHHVFADSENNGPRGQSLIDELIPAIESEYRAIGTPESRLLTGHSSGGWTSFWLQVTYPEFFGGVWSTAPDPVDFRNFQNINIYADANMFYDNEGNRRPLGRRDGKPVLFYDTFSEMEEIWGHGGQLQSFEAVFSEKGPDGKPMQLWDRESGTIDHEVAEQWKKYDMSLILNTHWEIISRSLEGKLHLYMGDDDTFYLEGAAKLIKDELETLGSDAVVELFPGKDHGSLMDEAMINRIADEMDSQLEKNGILTEMQ